MNTFDTYFQEKLEKWNPSSKYGIFLVIDTCGHIYFGQEEVNFLNAITRIRKQLSYGTFDKKIQHSYDKNVDIYFIEIHKILEDGYPFGDQIYHFYRKLLKGELLKFYQNSFYRVTGHNFQELAGFVTHFGKSDYLPVLQRASYDYFDFEFKRFQYYCSAIGRILRAKESFEESFKGLTKLN
jgi:hypothetical protein